MTHGAVFNIAKKMLTRVGMPAMEAGCHSFQRGTATGSAHVSAPDYVVKMVGIWGTDAYLGYIDATEGGSMERAMLAMAEADPTGAIGPRGIT